MAFNAPIALCNSQPPIVPVGKRLAKTPQSSGGASGLGTRNRLLSGFSSSAFDGPGRTVSFGKQPSRSLPSGCLHASVIASPFFFTSEFSALVASSIEPCGDEAHPKSTLAISGIPKLLRMPNPFTCIGDAPAILGRL